MNSIDNLLQKRWYFQGFNGTPALLFGPAQSMVKDMPDVLGFGYKTGCIIFFERDVCYYLYAWDDLFLVRDELLARAKADATYPEWLLEKDKAICDTVMREFHSVNLASLVKLNNEALYKKWREFLRLYTFLVSVSHSVEGLVLTTEDTIRGLARKEFPENALAITILTVPPVHSFISTERYELLKIAENCLALGLDHITSASEQSAPDIFYQLSRHTKKYFWKLNNFTAARTLAADDFAREINAILKEPGKIDSAIREYEALPELQKKRNELIGRIKSQELKDLLVLNNVIFEIHDRRKEYMTQGLTYLDAGLAEIGKRWQIPLSDLRYILPTEFESLPGIADELRERRKKSVYFLFPDCSKVAVSGPRADDIIHKLQMQNHVDADADSIQGNCAVPGMVRGRVKICRGVEEISKMRKGDILVACMTQPEFVPAMRMASAVITDEGGLTCHAAIVSRELGIPCVIGTKIATRVLKDGDMVEVDANKGIVRKL